MNAARLMFAILTATTVALPAPGIELTLTPIADSTVDAINPDAVDNDGQLLAAAEGDFGSPATTLSFVYTQFMLPDGLTGQQIGAINSVDLLFSRANPNVALSLTYYAYGVFDGFDFGSADDYTWNDGIGFFPENTEIRGFADENELSYYSDPAESSFIATLGSDSAGDPTLPFGLFAAQTETARANFRNLFLNDTDGKITIFTKVRQNFAVTALQPFESIEDVNAFTAAPTLIVDYSEPLDGDFNNDGNIDGVDFLLWQRGETSDAYGSGDLALWEANFGGGNATVGTISAIPEPTSLCCLGVGLLWLGGRRRR